MKFYNRQNKHMNATKQAHECYKTACKCFRYWLATEQSQLQNPTRLQRNTRLSDNQGDH